MSYVQTSFVGVAKLQLDPPVTQTSVLDGSTFTVQHLTIVMRDGQAHELVLHLDDGTVPLTKSSPE